jgi:hypothetical protein
LKSGVVSPDLTKSNTTTASTSQRKVLKGMALAGSFSVVYQLPEPKLAVLESVGGLHRTAMVEEWCSFA